MKLKNRAMLNAILLTLGLNCSAYAVESLAVQAQRCELGQTCPIPATDGGLTYFYIASASGNNYQCKINSSDDLRLGVFPGKDYKMKQGEGDYRANPEAIVNIIGSFDEGKTEGQIKFQRLNKGTGSVVCNAL